MTARPVPAAMALGMSEATLQTNVMGAARDLGYRRYHTHNSRLSIKGFPDLVFIHTRQDRCIFAELKRQNGTQKPEQKDWAADLLALTVVEYYLWRPSDWLSGDVTRILLGAAPAAPKAADDG